VSESKKIYMCGVDWQHEFQHIPDEVFVTDDIDHLKKAKPCWIRCGIVEVEVKLVRWIYPQNLDEDLA
jgi:hypothetical protein